MKKLKNQYLKKTRKLQVYSFNFFVFPLVADPLTPLVNEASSAKTNVVQLCLGIVAIMGGVIFVNGIWKMAFGNSKDGAVLVIGGAILSGLVTLVLNQL